MGSSASTTKAAKYGAKTTSDQIMKDLGQRARGKHVVVTGGNCGLGLETARCLAKSGAKVTIACRSKKLGDEAIAEIKKEVPAADLSLILIDLGNFESIRNFATKYRATGKPLDLLINNAGVMSMPKTLTSDGLEMQFGVNHIGHFILTTELLDVIKRSGTPTEPARIVNLSSLANWLMSPKCGIRFDDLNGRCHCRVVFLADRHSYDFTLLLTFRRETLQLCGPLWVLQARQHSLHQGAEPALCRRGRQRDCCLRAPGYHFRHQAAETHGRQGNERSVRHDHGSERCTAQGHV